MNVITMYNIATDEGLCDRKLIHVHSCALMLNKTALNHSRCIKQIVYDCILTQFRALRVISGC